MTKNGNITLAILVFLAGLLIACAIVIKAVNVFPAIVLLLIFCIMLFQALRRILN